MLPFETYLQKYAVGATFFVGPTALSMSPEAFDDFAEKLVAGNDPRVQVMGDPHRESHSGARRIALLKLERIS